MLNIQPSAHETVEVEKIYVTLLKNDDSKFRIFFCNICRSGIFQYHGNIISITPGDPDAEGQEVTTFPFYARCTGNNSKYGRCPALYIIQGYAVKDKSNNP